MTPDQITDAARLMYTANRVASSPAWIDLPAMTQDAYRRAVVAAEPWQDPHNAAAAIFEADKLAHPADYRAEIAWPLWSGPLRRAYLEEATDALRAVAAVG